MWFHGIKDIPRYEHYRLKQVRKKASWEKPMVPGGTPLSVDPMHFIYASTRVSILGQKVGLRGQLAGQGLGAVALCYLTPRFASSIIKPSNKIFLHHNFSHAKDFIGSSIKGTIGASLAYLEMQDQGYAWCGHREDCIAPAVSTISSPASTLKATSSTTAKAPTPDFLFASSGNVCLVDAKGSARTMKEVRLIAKNEWKRQIYSNRLTQLSNGGTATEGRIIAATLVNPGGVVLITAYGRFPSAAHSSAKLAPSRVSTTSKAIKSVQKVNFTNAFYLLGLNAMAKHFIGGPVSQARDELNNARLSVTDIDDFGAAYTGAPRFIDLDGQGAWTMQTYCRIDVLEEAFENLSSDDAPAVAETPPILALRPEKIDISGEGRIKNSNQVVLQSRDGVGAIFKRVK